MVAFDGPRVGGFACAGQRCWLLVAVGVWGGSIVRLVIGVPQSARRVLGRLGLRLC